MIKNKGSFIRDIENAKEIQGVYNIETFKKRKEVCRKILDGIDNIYDRPDWLIGLYYVSKDILSYWPKVGSVGDYDTFGEFSRRYINSINEFNEIIRNNRDVLTMTII